MARAKKETALTPEERLQAALVPDWEWPYKLPKNWCWTTVGTICDGFQYGYTEKATFEKIGPHFIRITDIGDGIINDSGAPYCKIDSDSFIKYKINKDDILIARMGSVGENGLATHNIDGVFASYLIRIVPRSNAKYVCNFLQTNLYWGQISEKAQGTTRLNVNANVLKNLIIPLPPLAEQQRIVDRIESLFAKLDEAKEKAQAVVDSFETRKAAILHKAFTGELTAKWREEHGVGMESWEKHLLSTVSSLQTGLMKGKKYTGKTVELPYLRVANVQDGFLRLDEIKKIDVEENAISRYSLAVGDVLFTEGGDFDKLGRGTVWEGQIKNCLHQNHIFVVRPNPEVLNPYFLSYQAGSRYGKAYFLSCSKQTTNLASINSTQLKNFPVLIPSMMEQEVIIRLLDSSLEKEQQTKNIAESVLDQIDLMKKSILARAFRGELGTNDPSEESAVELLKRGLEKE